MGRRSSSETVVGIIAAFIKKSSWEQSVLANQLGVSSRTLRAHLTELSRQGVQIERYEESDRQVFWSVPRGWLPDVVPLSDEDAHACVRLLARLPKSKQRNSLIKLLSGQAALARARADEAGTDTALAVLEDACHARAPVHLLYDAAGASPKWRLLSVHHIAHGDRTRFVGVVHGKHDLTWFRLDRVLRAERADQERFLPIDQVALTAYISESVDGFHKGTATTCRFRVGAPDAAWVRGNLPFEATSIVDDEDGVVIEVQTAGAQVVARFVVGLGSSARALTPELGERVADLARGALGGGADQRNGPARPEAKQCSSANQGSAASLAPQVGGNDPTQPNSAPSGRRLQNARQETRRRTS